MEQINYTKIIFALTIVISGFVLTAGIYAASHTILFGFNSYPNDLADEELETLKMEFLEVESIKTFKEKYPNHKTDFRDKGHIVYVVQTRNDNTGNMLSLEVQYDIYNDEGFFERLNCIPSYGVKIDNGNFRSISYDHPNLYIIESIKDTKCLDDDYEFEYILVEN